MAINVSQAFHRTSANPVDESMALTKAQMLTINDNLMPAYYFTICQDDGCIYLYDKSATPSNTTGKFTKFEGGSGGGSGTTPAGLVIDATLLASGWDANNQQTLTFTGYDSAMGGVIGMPVAATSAQKTAYAEAVINVVSQSGTSFTFEAETVPSVDLPVTLYAGGAGGSGGGSGVPEGGTTGQVLAKKSASDGDVEWVDPIEVDSALDGTSENPVQNKVINTELAKKIAYTPQSTTSAPANTDVIELVEPSSGNNFFLKAITWSNIKAALKTYFDTLYSTIKTSKAEAQDGTDLSLVTTGEKYAWSHSSGASIYANVFNKSDIYSTTEKVVGCWTDGKPIYQKAITGISWIGSKDVSVAHGITNMDALINAFFYSGKHTSADVSFTAPNYNTSTTSGIKRDGNTIHLYFSTAVAGFNTGTLVIQYTKTTDAANSFNYADENDYSTTEHVVGKWIDGKPVYQKTISKTGLTASNPITINFSEISTNLKQLIKDDICGINPNTNGSIVIPAMIDPTNNKKLDAQYNGTNKYLSITSDLGSPWNVYATFQYTKTTD